MPTLVSVWRILRGDTAEVQTKAPSGRRERSALQQIGSASGPRTEGGETEDEGRVGVAGQSLHL
jgi:hypothetical protein